MMFIILITLLYYLIWLNKNHDYTYLREIIANIKIFVQQYYSFLESRR